MDRDQRVCIFFFIFIGGLPDALSPSIGDSYMIADPESMVPILLECYFSLAEELYKVKARAISFPQCSTYYQIASCPG